MTEDEKLAAMHDLLDEIRPLLHGVHEDIVGGVLGNLVGQYFACHNPAVRVQARKLFDEMVDHLITIIDASPNSPWPKETRQ